MVDEKNLVVLDMTTPVPRRSQRAPDPLCPMDIALVETAWSEHARRSPPKVILQDPLRAASGVSR